MTPEKPFTHYVYVWKNYGPQRRGTSQRPGWWQREGLSYIKDDGEIFTFLHSTPIGGMDGRIRHIPMDNEQPQAPDWADVAAVAVEAGEAEAA
jgi:hypothetical protein